MNVEIYFNSLENVDSAVGIIKNSLRHHSMVSNAKITDDLPNGVKFVRIHNDHESNAMKVDQFKYYTVLLSEGSSIETINDDDGPQASRNWMLPNTDFDGLWESVYFGNGMKERLLQYAKKSVELSRRGIDPNIVGCNRLILLHGPPGTGKTTICKAIAQKVSVRLSETFPYSQLVEINCHSLFSKWFSESGKLVSKMFSSIQELAENSQVLVIVLIDEVESLTAARESALAKNEPSDAIRVVNAVLTQLDALRYHNNVLILATSNLTKAIDVAFSDRADIVQFVGLPGPEEIDLILKSCFDELDRVEICKNEKVASLSTKYYLDLLTGCSGRMIRKLPLMALAEHYDDAITLEEFARRLKGVIERVSIERKQLNK